jgi:hypothetical protein
MSPMSSSSASRRTPPVSSRLRWVVSAVTSNGPVSGQIRRSGGAPTRSPARGRPLSPPTAAVCCGELGLAGSHHAFDYCRTSARRDTGGAAVLTRRRSMPR